MHVLAKHGVVANRSDLDGVEDGGRGGISEWLHGNRRGRNHRLEKPRGAIRSNSRQLRDTIIGVTTGIAAVVDDERLGTTTTTGNSATEQY
jgi:hypothetical protein